MRKLMVFMATAAAVLVLLAGGCAATEAADNTATPPPSNVPALEGHSLAGTSWALVSYGDPANLKTLIAGTAITLSFNADTSEISGNGGINGYGGECARTDNQVVFSGIMHTLMASTNQAINEQESAYFALLDSAASVSFGEGTLTINCDGGQVLNYKTNVTPAPVTPPATSIPGGTTTCLPSSATPTSTVHSNPITPPTGSPTVSQTPGSSTTVTVVTTATPLVS